MSNVWKGGERLYFLSRYNRNVGLPSLLITSLIASLSVGLSLFFEADSLTIPLTIVARVMLIFMVVDAALILLNLSVMSNYLNHILSGLRRKGLPYDSLTGVEAIQDTLMKEIRYAIVLFVSSISSLTMYLLGILGIVMFVYLSLTSSLITFGFTVIRRRSALDPGEMLEIYEPDTYPIVLGSSTLLETFIDPFHWLQFDDYRREVSTYLGEGLSVGDAMSKMTLLLYQAVQGVITDEVVRREVGEMLKSEDYLSRVEEHQAFGFETLKIIVSKVRRLTPELTRLIDRMFLIAMDNLPDFKRSETLIDAEASWERRRGKTCNAFTLLFNNQDKPQRLSISYNAPSFSPGSGEVSITLPPRDFELPSEDSLPIYSEEGMDIIHLLSKAMDNTRFVWFSFETKETGVKPVVISVKDRETGATLFGKTFMVEAYYDLSGLLLKIATTSSVILGVFLSSFNFLRTFLKF